MLKYIVKRLVLAAVTVYIVATLTFFLMYLVPGGPFLSEKAPSAATLAALEAKYGLDQPVIVQYKNYMLRLLQGDLGTSLKQRGKEINDIIFTRLPASAKIGSLAVVVALVCGVVFGSVAALNRGKTLDNIIVFFSTCGIAVPGFVVCTVLMFLLGEKLRLLPTFGLNTPGSYIMPVLALAFYPMSYISRLMRSCMLDVLGQDYMRTAKAKGLSQTKALFKHALRNAILPVVTYLGPMLAYALTGSFVVETILTIPGLGASFVTSITARDYPLIMGTTIFLAFLIVTMNVVVDIVYKLVDPRINLR
ncbi:MAG TPA: ABC transporter permease [Firmicutes bacterium]|nr:ABC transporter permease [Bacillota bacterium]